MTRAVLGTGKVTLLEPIQGWKRLRRLIGECEEINTCVFLHVVVVVKL